MVQACGQWSLTTRHVDGFVIRRYPTLPCAIWSVFAHYLTAFLPINCLTANLSGSEQRHYDVDAFSTERDVRVLGMCAKLNAQQSIVSPRSKIISNLQQSCCNCCFAADAGEVRPSRFSFVFDHRRISCYVCIIESVAFERFIDASTDQVQRVLRQLAFNWISFCHTCRILDLKKKTPSVLSVLSQTKRTHRSIRVRVLFSEGSLVPCDGWVCVSLWWLWCLVEAVVIAEPVWSVAVLQLTDNAPIRRSAEPHGTA